MKKIKVPSFEEFERTWWDNHPKLAETELGTNGQFDEFPYNDYDDLINIIKAQKIYFKLFNVGSKIELAIVDSKGNRIFNGTITSISSEGLSLDRNINSNAELPLYELCEVESRKTLK